MGGWVSGERERSQYHSIEKLNHPFTHPPTHIKQIVEWLLSCGARRDIAARDGYTALHYVGLKGRVDLVPLLLHKQEGEGEDYLLSLLQAKTTKGNTPLHLAAQGGYVDVVHAFLHAGAELEARNKEGGTPLHVACWKGETKYVVSSLSLGSTHLPLIDSFIHSFIHPLTPPPLPPPQKKTERSSTSSAKAPVSTHSPWTAAPACTSPYKQIEKRWLPPSSSTKKSA